MDTDDNVVMASEKGWQGVGGVGQSWGGEMGTPIIMSKIKIRLKNVLKKCNQTAKTYDNCFT